MRTVFAPRGGGLASLSALLLACAIASFLPSRAASAAPDSPVPAASPDLADVPAPQEAPGETGASDVAPPQTGSDPDALAPASLRAFFDGMVPAQLRERDVAGATLAVVHRGEVVHLRGYGYADVERRRRVDPERTLFRIGSVTKLFTWVAVMQLVEEGLLDLDTDVNEYLDFRIPDTFEEPITLRHLMTHTPGFEEDLRNLFTHDPTRMVPLEEWVRTNLPARVRPPDTFSAYSNYGSALAGRIVEIASGMPWEDYVESSILDPLGIRRSTVRQPLPEPLREFMSQGYVFEDGGFVPREWEYVLGAAPAGSASATAADMARFMIAVLNGGRTNGTRLLESATVAGMLDRHFRHDERLPGLGLGFLEMNLEPVRAMGHGGGTGWFHTSLVLIPEAELGVFVSYNTSTAAPLAGGTFLETVLDRFFPGSETPPVVAHAETLDPLVGRYRFNRTNFTTFQKAMAMVAAVTIRERGGALEVRTPFANWRMAQVEPLLFRDEVGRTELGFRTDESGRSTHAFLSLLPVVALERVPWHGSPALHLPILAVGYLLFFGILLAPLVRRLAGWRRDEETQPRTLAIVRWGLFIAAAGQVAFLAALAVLATGDFWDLLTTPLTGLTVALAFPVLGAAGAAAATLALGVLCWKRGGRRRSRVLNGAAVAVTLLFLWSLHYWNLLGWYM